MTKLCYNDLKGKVFVFIGDNATTGKPNPRTGKLSYFGFYYSFGSDKRAAKRFVELYGGNAQIKAIGSARTLRKYALGLSLDSYLNHLIMLE